MTDDKKNQLKAFIKKTKRPPAVKFVAGGGRNKGDMSGIDFLAALKENWSTLQAGLQ